MALFSFNSLNSLIFENKVLKFRLGSKAKTATALGNQWIRVFIQVQRQNVMEIFEIYFFSLAKNCASACFFKTSANQDISGPDEK